MDLVYLWVDGGDPAWQARRAASYARYAQLPGMPAPSPARFADHGELRYSLRSVVAHGEAFERVFLVTDGQVPAWLEAEACASPRWRGRLTVVSHASVFPPEAARPCFASDNIAACTTRIPGLSRRYVVANDDVFLVREVAEADFFDARGRAIVRLCKGAIRRGLMEEADPYAAQWLNSIALLERHGVRPPWPHTVAGHVRELRRRLLGRRDGTAFYAPQHTFHAVDREAALEAWGRYAEPIAASLAVPFRCRHSVSPVLLYFYDALAHGAATPRWEPEGVFVASSRPDLAEARAALCSPRTKFLCLNECHRGAPTDWPQQVERLLRELYPVPSPFERDA